MISTARSASTGRVLKRGGKVLILELTLPRSSAAHFFLKLYFKHMLPAVTGRSFALTLLDRHSQITRKRCY